MKNSEITVIVPTHNRHDYLKRSFEYFKSSGVQVIYCDSSDVAFSDSIPEDIVYSHLPGQTFHQKIFNTLLKIDSRYVALCADDDFIIINALFDGERFLNENDQYVSVLGHYVEFKKDFDGIFSNIYMNNRGRDISADDVKIRLKNYFSDYFMILWAMHRREILLKAFEFFNTCNFNNDNFYEIILGAISCGEGKIKSLPRLWGVRERAVSWGQRIPTLLEYPENIEIQQDYLKIEKSLDKKYFAGFFKIGFNSYLSMFPKKRLINMYLDKIFCILKYVFNKNDRDYLAAESSSEEFTLLNKILVSSFDYTGSFQPKKANHEISF